MRWRFLEPTTIRTKILTGFAASFGEGGFGKVGDFKFGDGAPEALEIVVVADLFGKDVKDEAAKIEQGPIGGALAFAMLRFAL